MAHIRSLGIDAWLDDVDSVRSSRIRAVCQKINEHPTESITVFSCYRTALTVLRLYLPPDRPVFTIKGTDKVEVRATIINQFRASTNGILLLTYDIGANGINLQCSSVACLLDFFWNAGKSEQAVARLLRPGQMAPLVTFYYFTANTGMENAIYKMQQAKLARSREVLTGKITTGINKIKASDIARLLDQQDNIEILDHIVGT
jgi:SNF2 family DNA or RNA helicase